LWAMRETKQDEFEKYKHEVDESVLTAIDSTKRSRKYVSFNDYPWAKLKNELKKAVSEVTGETPEQIELTMPPNYVAGDFSLEVFSLAKKLGEKPNVLAQKIAEYINQHELVIIEKATVVGPFINVDARKQKLYRIILSTISEMMWYYGESDTNAGKVVVIDYSAPNIAKQIGVGHLRSTIIGHALSNIYYETGFNVIRDNHIGDWGTQFGKLLYAYLNWGNEEKVAKNPIEELKKLYIKFHEYAKENPQANDCARELFARLDAKDSELIALWKYFRDLSVESFDKIYQQLGVRFDTVIGESYFADQADAIVNECIDKHLCRKDEISNAIVVDKIGDIPSFLLKKQDGSSLYITRDLATLKFRIETFNPSVILYVVGSEQELNFKQMFALAKLVGYLPQNVEAKHIGFGLVLIGGKKMSTRGGTVIELQDLIYTAIKKSREILLQKNPEISPSDLDYVSKIVGIGAILYNDLSQSRIKNISFDWKKMLDMEGGSAVYLQYTYARINSIQKKLIDVYGDVDSNQDNEDITFASNSEFDLAKKLMIFPEIILQAQRSDFPHYVSKYLEELAQLFNSFYSEVSILKTEEKKLRKSRTLLIKDVALVIKKGLFLFGIDVPERM